MHNYEDTYTHYNQGMNKIFFEAVTRCNEQWILLKIFTSYKLILYLFLFWCAFYIKKYITDVISRVFCAMRNVLFLVTAHLIIRVFYLSRCSCHTMYMMCIKWRNFYHIVYDHYYYFYYNYCSLYIVSNERLSAASNKSPHDATGGYKRGYKLRSRK